MLQVGDIAPDFELQATDGSMVKLSSLLGKTVVIYFYPKDNTPGCTKEACNIRDNWSEYQKRGWLVFGISADSNKSHVKFTNDQSLPFPLLSDTNREVMKAFGAFGKKKFMGKEIEGTLRYTFVIGGDGKIVHIDRDVKVGNHSADLFQAVGK
ncbi:MAG: thioredoxin-dependent thiol peroxidase [bacterium]|nr:thioredoxin-dependent thiol peroxidase [bacterium]